MTPREALRSLLAVPYWVVSLLFGAVVASAFPDWWSYVACAVVGLTAGVMQQMLLRCCAGWMWARVEILASAWRELSGSIADIPLTSGNSADIEGAGQ